MSQAPSKSATALVFHQAMKDVRLLRWILAIWVVANIALHVAVLFGVRIPIVDLPSTRSNPFVAFYNVLLALIIAGFMIIPALTLHSDPPVSPTAFWVTRPLSALTVFGAKCLILVAALVLLPVVLDFLTLLAAGVDVVSAARPMPFALALQLGWLLPLVALAAVTASLPQLVTLALVDLALFAGLTMLVRILDPQRFPAIGVSNDTYGLVLIASLVVLSIVAIWLAYRLRDARRTITFAAVAPVVLGLVLGYWPWDVLPNRSRAKVVVYARPDLVNADITGPSEAAGGRGLVGTRYKLATNSGVVTDAEEARDRIIVKVHDTGFPMWRGGYTARPLFLLKNDRLGETLMGGPTEVSAPPFLTAIFPVPQHLTANYLIVAFPWTERPIIMSDWLRDARLVVVADHVR